MRYMGWYLWNLWDGYRSGYGMGESAGMRASCTSERLRSKAAMGFSRDGEVRPDGGHIHSGVGRKDVSVRGPGREAGALVLFIPISYPNGCGWMLSRRDATHPTPAARAYAFHHEG